KAELLAALVANGEVPLSAALHCRTGASAVAAREALELRGFHTSDPEPGPAPGSAVFRLATRDAASATGGVVTAVSYDVPFDALSLGERHARRSGCAASTPAIPSQGPPQAALCLGWPPATPHRQLAAWSPP